MSAAADERLGRRCRRLLWAYPSDYRSRRGEEIVGVLLDSARPGQTRPSLRDAGDLVRAGLVARAGATRASYTSSPWRDAVAVVSVLLPLFLAAQAVLWARDSVPFFRLRFESTYWAPWYVTYVIYGGVSAVLWVVVALAVVTRHIKAAAVWATAATAVQAFLVVRMAILDSVYLALGWVAVLVIEIVATLLLVRRPDVERGVDLVGRRMLVASLVGFALVRSDGVRWLTGYGLGGDGLDAVGRRLCLVGGLSVLAWVVWSRRQVLMAGALGLRLGVAGVVLAGIRVMTEGLRARTNIGHTTMKHLIILFGLCLLWATAVVVATALTSVAAARLRNRRPAE